MSEHTDTASQARVRSEWDAAVRREGRFTDLPVPAPPTGIRVSAGRGQVTLDWDTAAGAIGYLVHRADSVDGPFVPLDHLGGDVLAVPHGPYADTSGEPGRTYWYAIASLADVEVVGEIGPAVAGKSLPGGEGEVRVTVDVSAPTTALQRPWAPMIGAEHLSHLLSTETTGGRPIGAELREALATVHSELGVGTVRSHAILCDDNGVYRESGGEPVHDFTRVGEIYDALLALGLKPIVELSFMPRDLAADPSKKVFFYEAIVSPPKDWDRWADLIGDLTAYLVDRYGRDEVRTWAFEVWNEANLDVFWSGTREEYLRLYEVTAHAVKAVDEGLKVGGPGSAAAAWTADLLEHCAKTGAPVDFLSPHTYGSAPLDFRALAEHYGRPDLELLWTEWGVTPTHFNPVNDDPFSAAFLLRGMRSAAGRIEALAYWVASDHFEELGRPPRLFHGGFGLLSVGNLRKPRYWAMSALARLGRHELPAVVDGDGAGSLIETWCTRHDDGRVTVLIWNGTLDQSKVGGVGVLDRRINLEITDLPADAYWVEHSRIDAGHSNIAAVWDVMGGGDWPDETQWAQLHKANLLDRAEPDTDVPAVGGTIARAFTLPMPGVSLIELTPVG
ncbi:GH39 family glycosyl hydrolase [Phytomonospora endophytica]|uniref:Xylan 1,4-beta-xylosidase n=1 Tax=Phytomonospora endophytica TaxID=714109 RepID=A0A841FMP9_9ACTN|nr:xylan 1,4-beta-xylosidase [Phytomonospora endophytica]MBB6035078.1 xylan 1,4-beta-xylosidase [Phytomonospora endophytica]GIG64173.1 beta-xylosidase [Phytomonospora endophytica]